MSSCGYYEVGKQRPQVQHVVHSVAIHTFVQTSHTGRQNISFRLLRSQFLPGIHVRTFYMYCTCCSGGERVPMPVPWSGHRVFSPRGRCLVTAQTLRDRCFRETLWLLKISVSSLTKCAPEAQANAGRQIQRTNFMVLWSQFLLDTPFPCIRHYSTVTPLTQERRVLHLSLSCASSLHAQSRCFRSLKIWLKTYT